MDKVLVTGGSGFVGVNLIDYLESKKYFVEKVSLRETKINLSNFDNVSSVIHLAGKAHDTSDSTEDVEYFEVNYDLTIEIFEVFLESRARDFIYFSSVKAAADTVAGVLEEDVVPKPITAYGKSKLAAEKYLLSCNLPQGKRLFIIRPCMIHGPGNKGNLNLLYKMVEKGVPWPLAKFDNKRSFLSIGNLCFLIKEMITNSNIPSGVYNFADDNPVSTNELIELIARSLNKKPKMWYLNRGIMKNVARVGDVFGLPLNSERLKKLTENYVVNNNKIKEALFIEKLPKTSSEGLLMTLGSFQKKK